MAFGVGLKIWGAEQSRAEEEERVVLLRFACEARANWGGRGLRTAAVTSSAVNSLVACFCFFFFFYSRGSMSRSTNSNNGE